MRRTVTLLIAAAVLLPAGLGQGCGGVEHISVNPVLRLEEDRGLSRDGTVQAATLDISALQPREARIGDYVLVRGQGRIFPEGYARFTFSGNATAEVFLPRPVGEIRVRIPAGTLSGPLGFVVSAKSAYDDLSRGAQFATGDATPAFRIPTPGLRVLGPGEPPGGFPNSPYPVGPPMIPIPAPDFPGLGGVSPTP